MGIMLPANSRQQLPPRPHLTTTMTRPLLLNPLVWMRRFRHRRGYGVHSPFAFNFIRGVVYEHTPYYAYATLARQHPWWMLWLRLRPVACCRLLFRLANYAEARTAWLVGVGDTEYNYVRAAVTRARVERCSRCADVRAADFVLVAAHAAAEAPAVVPLMPTHAMLVVEGIHDDATRLEAWRRIEADAHTGVTFDLWDYGIAFFDHRLTKQRYVVNF